MGKLIHTIEFVRECLKEVVLEFGGKESGHTGDECGVWIMCMKS